MATIPDIFTNQKAVLFILSSALIAIIVFLIFIERQIERRKTIQAPPVAKEPYLDDEIDQLIERKIPDEKTFGEIDRLARKFFVKTYGIQEDLSYGEMLSHFKSISKTKAAEFAQRMLEYTYAGEPLNAYRLAILISLLKKIREKETQQLLQQVPEQTLWRRLLKIIKPSPQTSKEEAPEQKEDTATLVFENIRNLKPITIKPTILASKPVLASVNKPTHTEIDNLEHLRTKISERRKNLI